MHDDYKITMHAQHWKWQYRMGRAVEFVSARVKFMQKV